MSNYIPNGPYVFKSGKRKDQVLEILMFHDYSFVSWLYKRIKKEFGGNRKNQLHLHLDWLILQGENRKTIAYCPVCRKNNLEYFFVRNSFEGSSIGIQYSSCKNQDCINEIIEMGKEIHPSRYPFKFSSMAGFRRKEERKIVSEMFKKAFLPPGKLSRQKAFNLFFE